MKKILWMALFAAVIFSCKDDDENVNVTGTWLYVSQQYTNCDDPDDDDFESDDDGCDDGNCAMLEFSNGTYTSTETVAGDTYTGSGTYKIKGSKLTMDDTLIFTAKRNGNTLTLTITDDDDGCDAKVTFTKVG